MVVAIALAFSLYAGFPETAYIDGLLAAAWTLLRLMQCAPGDRIGFALRIGAGAVTGLLLAAPFVVPFLHMLTVSDLGPHALDFSKLPTPPAALPVLLMPYVLGPQSFGVNDPSHVLLWLWTFLGGYISLPVALLTVIAIVVPRPRTAPCGGYWRRGARRQSARALAFPALPGPSIQFRRCPRR